MQTLLSVASPARRSLRESGQEQKGSTPISRSGKKPVARPFEQHPSNHRPFVLPHADRKLHDDSQTQSASVQRYPDGAARNLSPCNAYCNADSYRNRYTNGNADSNGNTFACPGSRVEYLDPIAG
jgi:hypothetical protein